MNKNEQFCDIDTSFIVILKTCVQMINQILREPVFL